MSRSALLYNTAMTLGGAAQGLMVEINDGRPTKIEGNPRHPWSLGQARALPSGFDSPMYDPDRGLLSEDDGTNSNWNEFLDLVRARHADSSVAAQVFAF